MARYVWLTLIALSALAAAIVLNVFKQHLSSHEFTTDVTRQQFILGNDVLDIPLNLMRFENQRTSDVLNQVDLILTWPEAEGFTDTNSHRFLNPDKVGSLIFLTITRREMPLSMSERLEPVYSKLYQGKPRRGPSGLALRQLQDGTGYDGEELAIAPTSIPPWVARCQIENRVGQAVCQRDIFAGSGLSIRYRFQRALLPDWRQIERMVRQTLDEMVVTPK